MKYLPLFHHFKAIYQFPKHIIFLVKNVANVPLNIKIIDFFLYQYIIIVEYLMIKKKKVDFIDPRKWKSSFSKYIRQKQIKKMCDWKTEMRCNSNKYSF